MAEIVQLKNDNGASVYPVTMGEAINMAGGKTLDQAFNEAKSQILNDISSKKNELAAEVDEKKTEFNNLYAAKSGLLSTEFTTKTNELQTDFTAKKNSLKADFDKYSSSLDLDNKAGFYKGPGSTTNFPVGSILLVTLMDGGGPLDIGMYYGEGCDSPVYYTGWPTYYETGISSYNVSKKDSPLKGKWVVRGAFKTQPYISTTYKIPDPGWRILIQRVL